VTNGNSVSRQYYLTTRDLLMMAVLAGLGGVASTAINALGDTVQAITGFPGTTQWAAGLHVVVLLLSVGLTRKGGAATVTGLLKGAVEMLSGNTHGIIILLVDLVAGLTIDLVFLALRRRRSVWAYVLAGGMASASNVVVFQMFASAPEDILAFIWGIAGLAFASGVVLGGLLAHTLLRTLYRNGLVTDGEITTIGRWQYGAFLGFFAIAAIGGGAFLASSLRGPSYVSITGAVRAPYEFTAETNDMTPLTLEVELQGMKREVTGVPLRDVIAAASPEGTYGAVLVSATDGYSFFITRREIEDNDHLILACRGDGEDLTYEIAGAENSKAWVRHVQEIRAVPKSLIEVSGLVENAFPYDPDAWQFEMDAAWIDLGKGRQKYQGVLLSTVLGNWQPKDEAETLHLITESGEEIPLNLDQAMADSTLRIWTVSASDGIAFAIARESGEILATDVVRLEVD